MQKKKKPHLPGSWLLCSLRSCWGWSAGMLSAVTLPGLILLVQFTPGMKTDSVSLSPLMGLAPQHARSFGGSGKKIELGSRADCIGTGCARSPGDRAEVSVPYPDLAAPVNFFFTNFLWLCFFVCLLVFCN